VYIEIKKILCPVDFSECSDHALEYARAFAESYGSHLRMFHVIEFPYIPSYSDRGEGDTSFPADKVRSIMTVPHSHHSKEKTKKHFQDKLDELTEKSIDDGICDTSGEVVFGTPFVEIVKKAREDEFDLIVIGTHGRSALRHMIIGSIAERVVRKAPCPVLTVKHPEHEFVMP